MRGSPQIAVNGASDGTRHWAGQERSRPAWRL